MFTRSSICLLIACAVAVAQVPPPPRLIRVSGAVIVGLVETRTLPTYPEQAKASGIQGDVIFKTLIDETGKIVMSEPVEGDPLLVAASLDALRGFKFRPYMLSGNPVKVESQVGFHFGRDGKVEYLSTIPYRPEFRTGVLNAKGTFILWPRKLSGDDPKVPPELAGKSGSVYLTITVGADGTVQDVHVVGGDNSFVEPVVEAVKHFVYEPQLVDGKPSSVTIEATYHFGPSR